MTVKGYALRPDAGQPLDGSFAAIATADITPFLITRVTTSSGLDISCVVVATLVNPPADRLDQILVRQINTEEKFLRFLYLLLSLGDPHLLAQLARSSDGSDTAGGGSFGTASGVFELMLRALAEKPSALADLDRLVDRLQRAPDSTDVLPKGFEAVWAAVREAQNVLAGEAT